MKTRSVKQQLVRLGLERQKLQQEMVDYQPRNYLDYAGNPEFFKTVINEVLHSSEEEKEKMHHALLLKEKEEVLERLNREAQALSPVFTYARYEQSEDNVPYYLFNQQPLGMSNSDFDQMVGNQAVLQSECVSATCSKFQERFNAALTKGADFMKLAHKELQWLRKLLDPTSRLDQDEFLRVLKKLSCMAPVILPANVRQFHRTFLKCLSNPQLECRWTPGDLKQSLQDIGQDQLPHCRLFCRALIQFEGWLNELVLGKVTLNDHPELTYGQLFHKTVDDSTGLGNAMIEQIKEKWQASHQPEEAYKKFIQDELDKVKALGDLLVVTPYFHYLPQPATVKCFFVNNCLDSKDLVFHQKELAAAVVVDIVFRYLNHELELLGMENKEDEEMLRLACQTNSRVIAYLAPDEHIAVRVRQAVERAMNDWHNRKPLIYVLKDMEADFDILYEASEDHLFLRFDTESYEKSMNFCITLRNKIELLEYRAQTRGGWFPARFGRLRRLLEIRVRYLMDLHLSGLPQGQLTEKPAPEKIVERKLTIIIGQLNKKYNFLQDPAMTAAFVNWIQSNDLTKWKFQFNMGCKNTELKYILERLKAYNPQITWQAVSGIFISKWGTTLNAHALGVTNYDRLNTKRGIANIFDAAE